MDYFYLFLMAGSVIVFFILQFDKQQRRKVDTLLKNTSDVQPLLMMQCMGQKLDKINNVISKNGFNTHHNFKHDIEQQLRQLTKDYNCGNLSLHTYNDKLSELLDKVEIR